MANPIIDQSFYLGQFVNPNDMNEFYQNVGAKLDAIIPITPSILSGLSYAQTGTSDVIVVQSGFVRFKNQINELSTVAQFTWANIQSSSYTINCSPDGITRYVCAKVTKTVTTTSQVAFTSEILSTAYTLAEIALFANPSEYAPLWTVTNTAGVYVFGTDANCAINYGQSIGAGILANYVTLATEQQITGLKGFSQSPFVPDIPLGSRDAKAVNSGFVQGLLNALGINLQSIAIREFNTDDDFNLVTSSGAQFFGVGTGLPNDTDYWYMTRIAARDVQNGASYIAISSQYLAIGVADTGGIPSWTRIASYDDVQDSNFGSITIDISVPTVEGDKYVLTDEQYANEGIQLVGELTQDIIVVCPLATKVGTFTNATTGNFNVFIRARSGGDETPFPKNGTTSFVNYPGYITPINTALSNFLIQGVATLASGGTVPNLPVTTNDNQIASTAFVLSAIAKSNYSYSRVIQTIVSNSVYNSNIIVFPYAKRWCGVIQTVYCQMQVDQNGHGLLTQSLNQLIFGYPFGTTAPIQTSATVVWVTNGTRGSNSYATVSVSGSQITVEVYVGPQVNGGNFAGVGFNVSLYGSTE